MIPQRPTLPVWAFDHPKLDGPVIIEGIGSERVMKMWAIRNMVKDHPKSFTYTDIDDLVTTDLTAP